MPGAVSVFSGAGGLDLGFVQAGFRVDFANDVAKGAVATYSRNFGLRIYRCAGLTEAAPGVVAWCGIEKLDLTTLRGSELVLGGPPCQDFSIVRGPKAEGIAGARGSLVLEYARVLREVEPLVFVFENVPGLRSMHGGYDYRTLLSAIAEAGYAVVFNDVVDFLQAGVPQARRRLIIVGVKADSGIDAWELASTMRKAVKDPVLAEFPLTAMEVFEGRPLDELGGRYREVMEEWRGVWDEVNTPIAEKWRREVWSRLTMDPVQDYLAVNGISADEAEVKAAMRRHREVLEELGYLNKPVCSEPLPDGTCEEPREDAAVRERMRRIPPGENYMFVEGTQWRVEGRGISLIYRRLHPLKPAYTVVGHGGGGTYGYHYERGRAALTLRERARLQTFPDSFLFHGSRTKVRALIGDAVPPLFAKRLAEAVKKLMTT